MSNKKFLIMMAIILGSLILVGAIALIIDYRESKIVFTDDEKAYMLNYINSNYGNGEEIHVTNWTSSHITGKCRDTYHNDYPERECINIGVKSMVTGYFDSQDNCYFVTFTKYNKKSKRNDIGILKHSITINDDRCKKESLSGYSN